MKRAVLISVALFWASALFAQVSESLSRDIGNGAQEREYYGRAEFLVDVGEAISSRVEWGRADTTIDAYHVSTAPTRVRDVSIWSSNKNEPNEFVLVGYHSVLPPLGYSGVLEILDNLQSLSVPEERASKLAQFSYWFSNVMPRGSWDYKRRDDFGYSRLGRENFGNFNFGATGRAIGFDPDELDFGVGVFTGAGILGSTLSDEVGGANSPTFGDDPVDAIYSRIGMEYFDSKQYIVDYFEVKRILSVGLLSGVDDSVSNLDVEIEVLKFELNRRPAFDVLDSFEQSRRMRFLNEKEFSRRLDLERELNRNVDGD